MDLINEIFEKAKDFLLNPKNAFDSEKKTNFIEAFKYCIIWLFIGTVLSSIIFMLFKEQLLGLLPAFGLPEVPASEVGFGIGSVISSWISGIIGLFFVGLWLHLWVYLFGGRNKLENTLKAILYGNTPSYVLGWIPFVSMFAGIWSIILYAIGIMKLQNLSLKKTVGVLLISVIIPIAIVLILAAIIFIKAPEIVALMTL